MKYPKKLSVQTTILTPDGRAEATESLAVEQKFTVLLNEREIADSMLLPAGLEEFGPGFLFGLGYITGPEEIKETWVCHQGRISVLADIPDNRELQGRPIFSGCEGGGRISETMLEKAFGPLHEADITFSEIRKFLAAFSVYSRLGSQTHCIHSCGFWAGGEMTAFYEDISHNNAVDKIIGAILLGRFPPTGTLYTTGRLMSDTMLKCARIGIPIVMSRTAPSSLGLTIARKAGVTLAAYARPGRLNVFHRPDRIKI